MRVLRYWRLGLGAAIALSCGLAFADNPVPTYPECDRKPTAADLEGAKGAHRAASQFYDRGDYEKAIRYWNDAYGLDCTAHGVLINIANAYEKKGDKRAAVATLEAYLARTGPEPTIEEKIKNLKQSLEAAPPASASATVPTASASAPPPPLPTSSAPPLVPGPRPYGIAPWVVVGGGGVSAFIGLILTPVGYSAIADAEKKCPGRTCNDADAVSTGNAGRTQAGVGLAAIGVGAAAIAGGLVWQYMFNNPVMVPAPEAPAISRIRVTPSVSPREAGISVTGSF